MGRYLEIAEISNRDTTGSSHPSKANEAAFERAVEQVTASARELLDGLVTAAPPRDRAAEAARARARTAVRFGGAAHAG